RCGKDARTVRKEPAVLGELGLLRDRWELEFERDVDCLLLVRDEGRRGSHDDSLDTVTFETADRWLYVLGHSHRKRVQNQAKRWRYPVNFTDFCGVGEFRVENANLSDGRD